MGHENQEDEMMEELILDSSFEEWTGTFLGRESFGYGKKSVEEDTGAGSCAASQTRTRKAIKDDLGDSMEFMDRTVSLIKDKDLSHPRVTESVKDDSMVGVS